jgi:hypothetical protein
MSKDHYRSQLDLSKSHKAIRHHSVATTRLNASLQELQSEFQKAVMNRIERNETQKKQFHHWTADEQS